MAKTELTNVEEFYVANNPDNLSSLELAKQFGVTDQTVRNIQRKFNKRTKKQPKTEVTQEVAAAPESQDESPPLRPFENTVGKITRDRANTHNKITGTIMTGAASQIADEDLKSGKNRPSLSESLKSAIAPTRRKR
jgi:hypothetical protein